MVAPQLVSPAHTDDNEPMTFFSSELTPASFATLSGDSKPVGPGTLAALVHEDTEHADVLHVFGEIDLSNTAEFETAIHSAAGALLPVVINLEHCRYIDSSGLRTLVLAKRRLGTQFRLVVPQDNPIRRLFDITQLTQEFNVAQSVAEAAAQR
ncbi:MAG TPA: STAS domain-containing protein [Candidatus Baltobacteraceae bacterium]